MDLAGEVSTDVELKTGEKSIKIERVDQLQQRLLDHL